ncbi:MAG: glycosyltransferase family 2 protein [Planctomycetota bacterium]|nr:glycosyltransferase family 2 protein [Planctomycetota bacterium]
MRTLIAIPTYNEERYVLRVLRRVREHAENILVIDDGSTDSTPCLLPQMPVEVIRHAANRGYGRSLQDAFRWARVDRFDWVITMDCDEQHEPEAIPSFLDAIARDDADVISGSRYLSAYGDNDSPPPARRHINHAITREINERLGLAITDAFCGFKAYRTSAVSNLAFDVDGYAFPMQFWVQAVAAGITIRELPVKLIYNDPNRTFGGPLRNDDVRYAHYREILQREIDRCEGRLPPSSRHVSPLGYAGK